MRIRFAVLAALAALVSPALAAEEPVVDCRYDPSAPEGSGEPAEALVLPADDVFRPLLADPKEPRFSASWQRTKFRSRGLPGEKEDETINAGVTGFGGVFGLLGRRAGCEGAQLGIFGAVLSQFNLDAPSSDLINSDFLVGFPASFRWGVLSGRLRLYHQSSHLGDEFLLNNPEVDRQNLSFEAADGILSLAFRWLRLYGGGGYIIRDTPDLDPGILQGGVEIREPFAWSRRVLRRFRALPVAGADFTSFEEQDWDVTTSVAAGVELTSPASTRRLRVLAVYLRGFHPFGQFFNTEKIESWGLAAQFEL